MKSPGALAPELRSPGAESSGPRTRTAIAVLQVYACIGGFVSMLGWVLDAPLLSDWGATGISIQPNTTLAVMAASAGVLLLARGRRRAALGLGAFVAFVGGTALLQHLLGLDFGLDGLLLFGREWGRTGVIVPGRMGPPGATSWTLIGLALLLATRPPGSLARRGALYLALGATGIASLSLIGYLYGAHALYTIPTLTIIALQTASFIFAIALGLVLSVHEFGPVRVLAQDEPAAQLARRLLPALIGVPLLIGFLRLLGERAGLYDSAFGSSLRTLSEIVLFSALVWWAGTAINRETRKKAVAERALLQNQQRLASTLEDITDGFVTFDHAWRYTYVNTEAERTLGRPRKELLGSVVWELFPEMVGGEGHRKLHECAARRVSVEFEEFNPVLGRWLSNKATPTADGQVAVYFDDVTARKQAEQSLAESRGLLEAELRDSQLLRALGDELVPHDSSQELYEGLLDAAMQITGSDSASLHAMHVERGAEPFLLACRDYPPTATRALGLARAGSGGASGRALRTRERVIVPDVRSSEFLCGTSELELFLGNGLLATQSTPLLSRDGRLVGLLSTHWCEPHVPGERELRILGILARQAADLLERNRAEDALRERESSLKEAQRIGRLGSFEWNAATGATVVSDEFRAIFGLAEGEPAPALRAQDGVLFPHEAWLELDSTVRHAVRSGAGSQLELEALRRGQRIWVTIRCEPVRDARNRVIGLRGTVQDATERKHAEREREHLLAREKNARLEAERAGRIKDDFLATLSHELRTPLHAVIGWAALLKRDVSDPEKAAYALEVIERNAHLQARLISELLDMSRIASGKMTLELQPVELQGALETALASIRPAAAAKGLLLESSFQDAPAIVRGDPARLQQVVWNLLSNAVKFTPAGGSVRVVLASADGQAEIRVQDDGEGIAPEFLPHIFERFRQADGSATRSHGGLGLGLALVKQLVELHGGTVSAASAGRARGSEFVIRLPLARAVLEPWGALVQERALQPSDARPLPGLGGLRVLVVDDDPDALTLMQQLLATCEARVASAGSCAQALEVLRAQAIDVVVSDIGMPGRDGYALVAEMRRSGLRIPALAVTAFARSEDRGRALAAGYQDFVTKPVDAGRLVASILALAPDRPLSPLAT